MDQQIVAAEDAGGLGLVVGQRRAGRHHLVLRAAVAAEPERGAGGVQLDAAAAGRGQHAPPVGIAAVDRGLDQAGSGDGLGHLAGVPLAGRAADPHRDELGGALGVAHDLLGQVGAKLGQRGLEGSWIHGASQPVGQDQHGVVGAGVAVDADGVEAAVDGAAQGSLQRRRLDGRVGRHHRQHGGHVGMDHSRALGQAQQAGWPSLSRRQLGLGVGGHNGLRGQSSSFLALAGLRPRQRAGFTNPRLHLVHRQREADHAGGHDQRRAGRQAQRGLGQRGHAGRVNHPLLAGAGVGVARVDHHRAHGRRVGLQGRAIIQHRRGRETVLGEDAGRAARRIADDQGQIQRAAAIGRGLGLEAARDAGETKARNGDLCHRYLVSRAGRPGDHGAWTGLHKPGGTPWRS